jgi:amino acid transporter
LGRDRFLPSSLARVHPTYRTPHVAIWTHALIVFVIASTSSFRYLALVANVATLVLYLLGCAAAIRLVRSDVDSGGIPFAVPGGVFIPCAAIVVIVWFLSSAVWQEFAATGAVLVVASFAYRLRTVRLKRDTTSLRSVRL